MDDNHTDILKINAYRLGDVNEYLCPKTEIKKLRWYKQIEG